jgi:hypothetical protein
MTSKNLRGFSAGIIISTGILAGVYYTMDKSPKLTDATVEQYLSGKGEIAISETEYSSLKDAQSGSAVTDKKPVTPAPVKEEEKVVEMNLTITQGMSTGEVCDLLQKGKIIKDSKAFLKYLRSHNMEGAVRAETHQVNSKMNFDQIAKEITSS